MAISGLMSSFDPKRTLTNLQQELDYKTIFTMVAQYSLYNIIRHLALKYTVSHSESGYP